MLPLVFFKSVVHAGKHKTTPEISITGVYVVHINTPADPESVALIRPQ